MTQHGTPGLDRTGILAGSAAYLWWGLAAFYWVPAKVVPAVDLLAHRAFWAAPFCAVLLLARGRLLGAFRVLRAPRSLMLLGLSSALVALNWGIFLHAMGQNRLAEASLGYFMQPLVTVLIGLVGFRERLTPLQWMSVGFAAAGVAVYTSALGHLPLVALGVSVSFGLYGAVRRLVQVDSLDGLFVETVLLAPFALGWILWHGGAGLGAHGHHVDVILLGLGRFGSAIHRDLNRQVVDVGFTKHKPQVTHAARSAGVEDLNRLAGRHGQVRRCAPGAKVRRQLQQGHCRIGVGRWKRVGRLCVIGR